MQAYPKVLINYDVRDRDGNSIHEGSFRVDDGHERRAFLERSLDAYLKGHDVLTWCSYVQTELDAGRQPKLEFTPTAAIPPNQVWGMLRNLRRKARLCKDRLRALPEGAVTDAEFNGMLRSVASYADEITRDVTKLMTGLTALLASEQRKDEQS